MNNSRSIITLTGIDATALSAAPDVLQHRDELLEEARSLKVVTDAEQAQTAGAFLVSLKGFTRKIEDARTYVKAPVLDLYKRIDALAKELTIEAEQEAQRISRLVGTYNAEQARIAEKKRLDALAEEQRIKDETRAKLEQAEATGASEKKLDKIEAKAFDQLAVAKANTAAAVAPKLAGIATRKELIFEVTDIAALYAAHPMLVTLSPNNAAIKAILKTLPKDASLPGVSHRWENQAIVR